jgi:nucleotide-binding universal stress UspA family protein
VHVLTIVCPVDYSDCSKRALRFAGALAEHFGARLVVLHVFDPLIAGTAALHQFDVTGADGQEELRFFTEDHLPPGVRDGNRLERVLLLGTPGHEIIKLARERDADLLVIGTHGFSGVRKAFFGSTLQGVLRRAHVPVLAVPILDHRDAGILAPLISTGPVLAPVDFSTESRAPARTAAGLARALGLPLTLLHVVARPTPGSVGWEHESSAGERTAVADPATRMGELVGSLEADVRIATRIVDGEPAEQIARLAREKRSAVIVMSLGSSAMRRRRPGSIAYRVLCLAPVPVLALPETSSGRFHVQYLDEGAEVATTR